MKLQKLIIILFMAILFNNCRKFTIYKNRPSEQIKSWFFADSTSYWVYNVNNQYEDSVSARLRQYYIKMKETKRRSDLYDEQYELYFSNRNFGYIDILGNSVDIYVQSQYGDVGGMYVYNTESMKRHFSKNANEFRRMDTIMPKYITASGIAFDSTIVYYRNPDPIQQTDTGVYYFTKGVGFTRIIDKGRKIDRQLARYKYVRAKDLP